VNKKHDNSDNEFAHPELAEGEVFFTNASLADFERIVFKTKRLGLVAYDGNGDKITPADWYPVFLEEAEVIRENQPLKKIRRNFAEIAEL
jgi:hypothetical protein